MVCFRQIAVGDDVELYTDESRAKVLATFHFLRQQIAKDDGTPNWCLADFVAPKHSTFNIQHPIYHIGAFAVTSGHGLKELVDKFKADHDDYNAIMAEALADRLAEAFAEFLHKRVRDEWGFGKLEKLAAEDLIRGKISRHPAGGGLSGVSRSHGKGNSLEAARRGETRRHQADRKFRHVARQFGERTLFRAPGVEVFCRRQTRPRPVAGLSPSQRHDVAGG